MKRYEFHSALPPERVLSRLSVRAKPWDPFAAGDGTFRFKRQKESFRLAYMGTLPTSGFIPFWGEVCQDGAGSVITGGFSSWRATWKQMAVLWGVMCVPVMMLGVPLPVYLLMFALGLFVGGGFQSAGQKVFFQEYQRAVLAFIEDNLLK